jgi:hypothetical protein
VSRCHATGQALLDIAQEMMTVVLAVWLNRDHLQSFNHAFNWLVSSIRRLPIQSIEPILTVMPRLSATASPALESSV